MSVTQGSSGVLTHGTITDSHTYTTAATYTVTVIVTDQSGGVGQATFTVTVLASGLGCTTMATPVITGVSNASQLTSSSATTSDPTLVIFGTGEPDSTVTVSRNDIGVLGTTTVGSNGNWRFDYTSTALPAGSYTFAASETPLGSLSDAGLFNVLVFGSATLAGTNQGRVAVGGNMTTSGTTIGSGLSNSNGTARRSHRQRQHHHERQQRAQRKHRLRDYRDHERKLDPQRLCPQ